MKFLLFLGVLVASSVLLFIPRTVGFILFGIALGGGNWWWLFAPLALFGFLVDVEWE